MNPKRHVPVGRDENGNVVYEEVEYGPPVTDRDGNFYAGDSGILEPGWRAAIHALELELKIKQVQMEDNSSTDEREYHTLRAAVRVYRQAIDQLCAQGRLIGINV